MERFEWDFGAGYRAVYSELTGQILAFAGDERMSLVGYANSPERALELAREWFGGAPPRQTKRYPVTLNVFPFP